MLLLGFVSREN
ncbi:hypothetical protein EC970010_5783A, partial [Escherichia coli 97.0010]